MISNLIFDALVGGASYGTSFIGTLIGKALDHSANKNNAMIDAFKQLGTGPKTEEDKERAYALAVRQLEQHEKSEKMTYDDINNARAMQSRFVGVTRRGIAWAVIPYFLIAMTLIAAYSAYSHYPAISVPVKDTSSFLFGLIKSEKTVIKQVHGLLIPTWIPTLMFMVAGFYFGRESVK